MVVLLYNPNANADIRAVSVLEKALRANGCDLFLDRRTEVSVAQAQLLVDWIKRADQVIAVISTESADSETLEFQLETVASERRRTGKPGLITLRLNSALPVAGPIASYLLDDQTLAWDGEDDDLTVVDAVLARLKTTTTPQAEPAIKEPVGSAPASNRFYTLRHSDSELDTAMWAHESVVLIRGPRQIGKTSLIGRGIELANAMHWRTVSTDFQKLNSFQLNDVDRFCQLLAKTMARQLRFDYDFDSQWIDDFGPNLNLDHFVREAIESVSEPLCWFMDEADRIFTAPFASDFYGLVRSWHNARATDPTGPWSRFSVVIGYATEARLFIQDLNQSPFNVGKNISLANFNIQQTTDLNVRFGEPLKRQSDIEGMQFLLGGQPMLTKRALELLATRKIDFATLIETADHDDGPFADHLKRVLFAVSQAPDVLKALKSSLSYITAADSGAVERLVAAGVLRETSEGSATLACDLYTQYLARHLS